VLLKRDLQRVNDRGRNLACSLHLHGFQCRATVNQIRNQDDLNTDEGMKEEGIDKME